MKSGTKLNEHCQMNRALSLFKWDWNRYCVRLTVRLTTSIKWNIIRSPENYLNCVLDAYVSRILKHFQQYINNFDATIHFLSPYIVHILWGTQGYRIESSLWICLRHKHQKYKMNLSYHTLWSGISVWFLYIICIYQSTELYEERWHTI